MSDSRWPLAGIRVLDLSRVLAGPVCCQVLADLGADVVKVERPGNGDDTRHWGPPFAWPGGPSAYFLSCNRGKRSLALDLARPEGRQVLFELIARADVLVENFLPDALERFGLVPEELARLNPRLVSCSISGYGRTGPWAARPGYDLAIQATSGLMALTGPAEGPPSKVGVALSDVLTGLYAAVSALAGLHARTTAGSGMAFDLALADCTLASLVNVAQAALITGQRPERYGNAHPQIVPYEVLATADGHLALAVGNDAQWQRLCRGLGQADWADDPRLATNPQRVAHRQEVIERLAPRFAAKTTAQWIDQLTVWQVPHAPVLALDEALALEQTAARDMIQEATDGSGRRYRLLATPIHWQGQVRTPPPAPPALGQHTAEVLTEWLGYAEPELNALRQSGVVG